MSRQRGQRLFLVALFLAALALRPQVVGIGPLLPEIRPDLDVSHGVAGLLGTIPVLCMGVFAFPAARVARRLGARAALAGSVAAIGVFGTARALVPGAAGVIALTVPASVGMGLGNALLPAAVKERFPARPAFATGVYVTGINVGSTAAAGVAVPLADAFGGWRAALAAFSVVTLALAGAWLAATGEGAAHRVPEERAPQLRSPRSLVLRLVTVFALMSSTYYGLNAWLPATYVERGWDDARAGALLAVLNLASIPAGLLVAAIADRLPRRRYLVCGACAFVVSVLGIELLPGGAWIWAVAAGVASGTLFPLVMTLPLDVSHRPAETAAVAGTMLGFGYGISACAPFALGAVRDLTGSFENALWLLLATSFALLAVVSSLSARRLARQAQPEALVAP